MKRPRARLLLGGCGVLLTCWLMLSPGEARAQFTTYEWRGISNSDWAVSTNWSGLSVGPTGGTYAARLNVQNNSGSTLVYDASLGYTIYNPTGSPTARALVLGNPGPGSMIISGGVFESQGLNPDIIGNGVNTFGGLSSLTVAGGEYVNTNGGGRTLVINNGGAAGVTGIFTIASGTASISNLQFGVNANAGEAIVNLNGGTLNANIIKGVGTGANKTFNFNGGTLAALATRSDFMQGLTRANVSTNGAIIDNRAFDITIGQALEHDASLGATQDGGLRKRGTGRLTLTGSNTYDGLTVVEAGALRSQHASGLGTALGGTVVSNNARVELSGGFTVAGEAITINGMGGNNQGALQSVSGSNTWAGQVILASGTGSSGTRVGAASGGVLEMSGQITNVGGSFDLGVRTDGSAGSAVVISGGNNAYRDTYAVVGTLAIAGGDDRLPTATVLHIGNGAEVASATFDLNGFNQRVAGLVSDGITMPMLVTNSAGATTSRLTIDNPVTRAYAGAIGGNLELVKTGVGLEEFRGANSYAGATILSNGTLRVNGTHVGGGQYSVMSGATLGGTGMIDAAINVLPGGFAAPGNPIGTLVTSNTFDLDGILQIELANAAGPAGLSDMLDVNGIFDLTNGTVQFFFTGTMTNAYYLFGEYDARSGSAFANVLNLPTGYGIDYEFGGGNQIALVIPEPATWGLLLLGLGLVVGLRHRR
ncbi:MAG TPA: autotransporter-associated beta strand repeat-containing protein [Verrucomicrobiae bacterium]|nr:autotransporter-associated beta strand repeat-containing protein [Verrucomicrobiae bacterium]